VVAVSLEPDGSFVKSTAPSHPPAPRCPRPSYGGDELDESGGGDC
jgi:hypothetical protein